MNEDYSSSRLYTTRCATFSWMLKSHRVEKQRQQFLSRPPRRKPAKRCPSLVIPSSLPVKMTLLQTGLSRISQSGLQMLWRAHSLDHMTSPGEQAPTDSHLSDVEIRTWSPSIAQLGATASYHSAHVELILGALVSIEALSISRHIRILLPA
jgi:hypothetical protein